MDLKTIGVRGIYLGNYVRWDPKDQHEQMIRKYGYNTAHFSRTFDCYDYVDCFNYMNLHDQLKLYKHGFSKVTDHACREIRYGRLTRSVGLALVQKYEQAKVENTQLFCDWLGVTERSLQFLLDQHRNPQYWIESSPKHWNFIGSAIRMNLIDPSIKITNIDDRIKFTATSFFNKNEENQYITFGKGFSQ